MPTKALTQETNQTMNLTLGFDSFINEEVSILNGLNEKRVKELMTYSKSFLDKVFPLEQGSHQDVSSYVIYYKHLLAFFPDGSKSGLAIPNQFVALRVELKILLESMIFRLKPQRQYLVLQLRQMTKRLKQLNVGLV